MKKKFIIGNWKSNKNISQTKDWFKIFQELFHQNQPENLNDIETVVCLPYILLPLAKKLQSEYKLPLKLGAQNISPFDSGAYTGEVSGVQISEVAEYVLIGHSERRKNFMEDDNILSEKVKRANEAKLNSIYCVQDENTFVPPDVQIVAYEPVWAIGTGKTDTPQNANNVARMIKEKNKIETLIYGGSVTEANIESFVAEKNIDGVLPGGSSLDPARFWQMIVNVATI